MFKTWMYCMQLMPSAKTFITTTLQQVHRKLVISIQSLFYMNLSGESTKQFISVNKRIVIIGCEQEKHMAWINIPVLEANYAKLYTMTELRLCIETRCIAWSRMTNHLYGSLRWCIRKIFECTRNQDYTKLTWLYIPYYFWFQLCRKVDPLIIIISAALLQA